MLIIRCPKRVLLGYKFCSNYLKIFIFFVLKKYEKDPDPQGRDY
jgi:hypothetical protein